MENVDNTASGGATAAVTEATPVAATPQSFLQELIAGVKNLETDFLSLVEKHNTFVSDVQAKLTQANVTLNADAHLYKGNAKNLFEGLITSLESGFTDRLHAVESFFGLGKAAAVAPAAPVPEVAVAPVAAVEAPVAAAVAFEGATQKDVAVEAPAATVAVDAAVAAPVVVETATQAAAATDDNAGTPLTAQ